MRQKAFLTALLVCALALLVWRAPHVGAFSDGIPSQSEFGCGGCHGGGQPPVIELEGARTVTPSVTVMMQLVITSTAPLVQTHAGYNISVLDGNFEKAGTLQSVNGKSQVFDGELVHTAPLANQDGASTFEFEWTAPATPGTYTLYYAGNSVNLDGGTGGDQSANSSAEITVANPTAVTLNQRAALTPAPRLLLITAALVLSTLFVFKNQKRQQ